MRRTILFIALSTLPLALALPSGAYHSGTCAAPSSLPDLGVDSPKADVLDPNEYHHYRLTVPAGEHYVLMQPINGDADMRVCKVGDAQTTHKCVSENMYPVGDFCLAPGLGGNPGAGAPLIGPGTFRIMVHHCWHFDPNQGLCDYSLGNAPPGTIPSPPVAYLIAAH